MDGSRLLPARVPALVLALLALPAAADSFRCGSMLVNDGDSASELLSKCGRPKQVTSRSVMRAPVVWYGSTMVRVPGEMMETKVETWVYDFGPHKLMQQVEVEGGIVTSVRSLGYGKR